MRAVSSSRVGRRLAPLALGAAAAVALGAAVAPRQGVAAALVFSLIGISIAYSGWMILSALSALSAPALSFEDEDSPQEAALKRELRLLSANIQELDADLSLGKIAPEDHEALRGAAEARSQEIRAAERAEAARWQQAAASLIRAHRGEVHEELGFAHPSVFDDRPRPATARADGLACPCGGLAPLPAAEQDRVFCPACGRPLELQGEPEAAP